MKASAASALLRALPVDRLRLGALSRTLVGQEPHEPGCGVYRLDAMPDTGARASLLRLAEGDDFAGPLGGDELGLKLGEVARFECARYRPLLSEGDVVATVKATDNLRKIHFGSLRNRCSHLLAPTLAAMPTLAPIAMCSPHDEPLHLAVMCGAALPSGEGGAVDEVAPP